MKDTLAINSPVYDEDTFNKTFQITQRTPWIAEYKNRTEALSELYQLCENQESWALICHLIREFTYINEAKFNIAKNQIAEKILECVSAESIVWICATSDSNVADGSQLLLQSLKNAEALIGPFTSGQFLNSITEPAKILASKKIRKKRTIILIDDFIGSSKTISSKIFWLRTKVHSLNLQDKIDIKIYSLALMENAKSNLDFFLHSGMISEVYSPFILKKGISDHFTNPNLSLNIDNMNLLENKLALRNKHLWLSQYKFGYKKTEALFSWQDNNIPNNVFPIFWWPQLKKGGIRNTVFRRIC